MVAPRDPTVSPNWLSGSLMSGRSASGAASCDGELEGELSQRGRRVCGVVHRALATDRQRFWQERCLRPSQTPR